MKKIKYSNDDITIVWQPELCQHTTICFSELPKVFNPQNTKWIDTTAASTNRIIEQLKKCPSGALTFYSNTK